VKDNFDEQVMQYTIFPAILISQKLIYSIIALALPQLVMGGSTFEHARANKAGFVVAKIDYVLGPDATNAAICPGGMTEGYGDPSEIVAAYPEHDTDKKKSESQTPRYSYRAIRENPNIKTFCSHPELGKPDTRFKTLSGIEPALDGIDLDRFYAQSGEFQPSKGCPHNDFPGIDNKTGIDNQFYRFAACSPSFQSTGISNGFSISMLTGAWGILIEIDGIDDLDFDDEVTVSFYANNDPIKLSAAREPLPFASYSATSDPRYRATTTGRIRNRTLITDPIDLRFHWVVNTMFLERTLGDAVGQLHIHEDGTLEGFLAGYAKIEDVYDYEYGYRNAKDSFGKPAKASLRNGSAAGKSLVQGYTCQGAYQALYRLADGDRDDNGQCHSISLQYRIKAIPAFTFSNP